MSCIGKLGISLVKHFDHKLLLHGNVQLIIIFNVDRQESFQYIFLDQNKVRLSLVISQVCVPQALKIPSHPKTSLGPGRNSLAGVFCLQVTCLLVKLLLHLLVLSNTGFVAEPPVILNKSEY